MPYKKLVVFSIIFVFLDIQLFSQEKKKISLGEIVEEINLRAAKDFQIFVSAELVDVQVPFETKFEVDLLKELSSNFNFEVIEYSKGVYLITPVVKPDDQEIEYSDVVKYGSVSGFVKSYKGKTLQNVGVAVMELQRDVFSNANGYFYLDSIPAGDYTLQYGKRGFNTDLTKISVENDLRTNLTMFEETFQLDEVAVYARSIDEDIKRTDIGLNKLSAKSFEEIPSFMGQPDPVKMITVLPGVSNLGDGAGGGFNVRGGGSDQNLILFDGAPLYVNTHLFGLIPLVNANVLDDVSIYKGNFSSQYGGRLSSVLVLNHKDASFNSVKLKGSVGLVSSNITLETPLVENKVTHLFSGRLAYPDYFIPILEVESLYNTSANFADVNSKISFRNNGNFKGSYSNHYSFDQFAFGADTSFFTRNYVSALNLNFYPSEAAESRSTISFSKADLEMINGNPNNDFTFGSYIQDLRVKSTYNYRFREGLEVYGGLSSSIYMIDKGDFDDNRDGILDVDIQEERFIESALFGGATVAVNENLNMEIGLRYSSGISLGAKQSYEYENNEYRQISEITDTISYSKNEMVAFHDGFEPRLTVSYSLNSRSSFKFGFSKTLQYLNQLSNSAIIAPYSIWQTSNEFFEPQISNQVSIGYLRAVKNIKGQLGIEAYYKVIDNAIDYLDNAELLLNQNLETDVTQGESYAYGLEVLAEKNLGKITGKLSYTYSRAFTKLDGEGARFVINDGEYYPAFYDKPHSLNITSNYKHSDRFSIGLNFVYASGNPITIPIGQYLQDRLVIPIYSERNGYRIADYHRADLSFKFKPNGFKKNPWIKYDFDFTIYNLYGRRNPYSIFFSNSVVSGLPEAYRVSIIGSPFPSFTINFHI